MCDQLYNLYCVLNRMYELDLLCFGQSDVGVIYLKIKILNLIDYKFILNIL